MFLPRLANMIFFSKFCLDVFCNPFSYSFELDQISPAPKFLKSEANENSFTSLCCNLWFAGARPVCRINRFRSFIQLRRQIGRCERTYFDTGVAWNRSIHWKTRKSYEIRRDCGRLNLENWSNIVRCDMWTTNSTNDQAFVCDWDVCLWQTLH